MADEQGAPAGRGGFSKKYGGVPLWAWTVGGTVGVVSLYLIWRSRKAAAAAAGTDPNTAATAANGASNPTDIIPINQGLGDQQYQDILSAIRAGQGPASTPPGSTPPGGVVSPGGGATPPPAPKPKPVPKPSPGPTHPAGWPWSVVGAGNTHETVAKILAKYNISLTAFRRLNPNVQLTEPSGKRVTGRDAATYSKIAPGTRLRVG